jgi:hypothetical protein
MRMRQQAYDMLGVGGQDDGQGGGYVPSPENRGGGTPEPGQTNQVDRQVEAPKISSISPSVEQMASRSAQSLMNNPMWKDTLDGMPEDSQAALFIGMGTMADSLVRSGLTTPEMAPTFVQEQLEGNGVGTVYLMTLSGYSNDQIKAKLKAAGRTDAQISNMFDMVRSYANSAKRGQR